MKSPTAFQFNPIVEAWLKKHRLTPPPDDHSDWYMNVSMSTAPLRDYIARKSRIKPHELFLGLNISRLIGWRALLEPRDKGFSLSWRPTTGPQVDTEIFAYKHRTKWPTFTDLDALPVLVPQIEQTLGVKFLRHIEIFASSLKTEDIATVSSWVSSLCDTLELTTADLYGELPVNVEYEDDRAEEACITFLIQTKDASQT